MLMKVYSFQKEKKCETLDGRENFKKKSENLEKKFRKATLVAVDRLPAVLWYNSVATKPCGRSV